MATAWIVPAEEDVRTFLSSRIVKALAPIDYDTANESRTDDILGDVVAEVRQAISDGGKIPVSLTASSVPPCGRRHTLTLTVDALAAVEPQLAQYVESEAFKRQLDAANEWLKRVRDGKSEVEYPTDPDLSADGQQRTLIISPNDDSALLTRSQMDGL